MSTNFLSSLAAQTEALKEQGLFKSERLIAGPQQAAINVRNNGGTSEVINLCANNYLGLANHPAILDAAHKALDEFGYGMASVRFICGTQTIHKELEQRISSFLGTEDTILYPSCFDANGGLFETLLSGEDAVISDALNHASIIDGIRLCKAGRYRYQNNDMDDLESRLKEAADSHEKLIVTDGVFSMDGTIANLADICDLADRYGALTMIDDCHASGFLGATGRGTHEYRNVMGRIDIITVRSERRWAGPPAVSHQEERKSSAGSGSVRVLTFSPIRSRRLLLQPRLRSWICSRADETLRSQLRENATRFRQGLSDLGFDLKPGEHPIIPVMLGDARLAGKMADRLLQHGIYVIGFSFPVVPEGQARIRTQMSAGHTREQIDQAIEAFATVGRELGVIH